MCTYTIRTAERGINRYVYKISEAKHTRKKKMSTATTTITEKLYKFQEICNEKVLKIKELEAIWLQNQSVIAEYNTHAEEFMTTATLNLELAELELLSGSLDVVTSCAIDNRPSFHENSLTHSTRLCLCLLCLVISAYQRRHGAPTSLSQGAARAEVRLR